MIVGVPVESHPGERRVALVPSVVPALAKAGLQIFVESGAGANAGFADTEYEEKGARLTAERAQLFSSADVLLHVHGFGVNPDGSGDLNLTHPGQVVVGFQNPFGAPEGARELAEKGITAFALELLPRISRAQPMDALSSMAMISGYKAGVMAAAALDKIYPLMMTAAGTVTPARVFVVGAGVAGLQAIATTHRLGAVVQAYDVRSAVREQVESLGAKFVELDLETEGAEASNGYAQALGEEFYHRQRELMTQVVAETDVVITTAAIPGKRAPVLFTKEMVRKMRPGSVVLDLAAESGGNCELTRPGETVKTDGITVLGPINVPSTVPFHASQMYAKNVAAFLLNLVKDGELRLNLEDQIVRETLLTHEREVFNSSVRELLGLPVPTERSSA